MGSNPIGPNGPHLAEEKPDPPITTKTGAAAQLQKSEIGPNGPHPTPVKPTKTADDSGPSGPHGA